MPFAGLACSVETLNWAGMWVACQNLSTDLQLSEGFYVTATLWKMNMTKKNSNTHEAKEPDAWWAAALAESDKLLNATTEDKKDSSEPPELKVTFVPNKK